jgi:hypothetical protein
MVMIQWIAIWVHSLSMSLVVLTRSPGLFARQITACQVIANNPKTRRRSYLLLALIGQVCKNTASTPYISHQGVGVLMRFLKIPKIPQLSRKGVWLTGSRSEILIA